MIFWKMNLSNYKVKKKICIVTGTRAEWGLLSRLAAMIRDDNSLDLQLVATNMHLIERYGMTIKEIEGDGFQVDYRVPMEVEGDSEIATVQSMGIAMQGFAKAYDCLRPDILLILGDRYEILAAVSAALIFKIPVAHIGGGEITEGAYDDAIRHAITKLSHLHFTSTEEYRQNVIQMGENPDKVFNVGAIGVDNILQHPLWDKQQTEESLGGFRLDDNTVIATYHPVTMEHNTAEEQITALLEAFDEVKQLRIIFTMPNSDTGNQIISQKIKEWCMLNPQRTTWFTSLGLKRYLSTLQYIRAVVGNSSSGLVEAPSFGIYTLNIGNRQKGRTAAASVINCLPEKNEIIRKLHEILNTPKPLGMFNPYYQSNTAAHIVRVLKEVKIDPYKQFYKVCND